MTGYRNGYDFRKWAAATAKQRPRRRSTRWLLTIATALVLGYLTVMTVLSRPDTTGSPGLFFVWLPLIVTMSSPFARDTWLTDRGLEQYDEFERAALARATSRAYLLLLVGAAAALLALAGAINFGSPIAITPRLLVIWVLALLGLGVTLPVLLAEWTVPMPDPEDQTL